jgi:hypothetical protein
MPRASNEQASLTDGRNTRVRDRRKELTALAPGMRLGHKFPFSEPLARYAYIDKIQFWVRDPLDRHTLNLLKAQCGGGGLSVWNQRARFDHRFRQRVQLRQPTAKAFQLLAKRNGLLINAVEIALDLIFKNRFERDAAREFFHKHLVRPWHGSRQKIVVYQHPQQKQAAHDHSGQTRYDAPRSAPNSIVIYPEDFTRVTGEPDCLHVAPTGPIVPAGPDGALCRIF